MKKDEEDRLDNKSKGKLFVISGDKEGTVEEAEYQIVDGTYEDENGDIVGKELASVVLAYKVAELFNQLKALFACDEL